MASYLSQLSQEADKHNCPIVCAGDIFDDGWRPHRCPPELINFAIQYMPPMYAIPGQHDLPFHRYDLIERSAYWTLCAADKITNIQPNVPYALPRPTNEARQVIIDAFPWGVKLKPLEDVEQVTPGVLRLCLAHRYVWIDGRGYPGADDGDHIRNLTEMLDGYDVALFGDNHKSFLTGTVSGCQIFNHGTFMRRKIDERSYQPMMGLLRNDGTIKPKSYNVSHDKWIEIPEAAEREFEDTYLNGTEFLTELASLGDAAINFSESVKRWMKENEPNPRVYSLILQLISK